MKLPIIRDPKGFDPHLRNAVQAGALILGLTVLMLFCGWLYAGVQGAVVAVLLGAIGMGLARKMPLSLLLRLNGAERLAPSDLPVLGRIVAELCGRAGLARMPALYAVPSAMPTAFTMGSRKEAALVVTGALLRLLPTRELAAVLAHEIAHIRRHDVELMQLAAAVGLVIQTMARLAILFAVLTVWLSFFDMAELRLPALTMLVAAPVLANLLQLALSRTREYEADLEAIELTGDPAGLASALEHIESIQERVLDSVVPGTRRMRLPGFLSSHPPPEARIRRIRRHALPSL